MEFKLYPHQEEAVSKLKSGSILYGGVGSGKSLAALFFYSRYYKDRPLYIITTAKKRDSKDWQNDINEMNLEGIVDSWNNIRKYNDLKNCFIIFDEQRVIGYSAWAKTFIKISKNNKWILLSATPGDTWMDYIPVFIANGFYKNKTDFTTQHVEYDNYVNFPKIKAYHNEGKLINNRNAILVRMPMERNTIRNKQIIFSEYSNEQYKLVLQNRWNIFKDTPIRNASELTHCLRRVVSTDPDRIYNATVIMDITDKLVIFYNYNYELDILKGIASYLKKDFYQWNGHIHEPIPDTESWLYFVQYTSGSEGWNCTETNTMLFYSLNPSYRTMEQAEGRIDRLNTSYKDLEYYTLSSKSKIDQDVMKAVINKKNFNAAAWARKSGVIF